MVYEILSLKQPRNFFELNDKITALFLFLLNIQNVANCSTFVFENFSPIFARLQQNCQ